MTSRTRGQAAKYDSKWRPAMLNSGLLWRGNSVGSDALYKLKPGSVRDWSISIGGGGPGHRWGGSLCFQPSLWGGLSYFQPQEVVSHYILNLVYWNTAKALGHKRLCKMNMKLAGKGHLSRQNPTSWILEVYSIICSKQGSRHSSGLIVYLRSSRVTNIVTRYQECCLSIGSNITDVTATETQHSVQLRTCSGEHQPIVALSGVRLRPEAGHNIRWFDM